MKWLELEELPKYIYLGQEIWPDENQAQMIKITG